MKILRVMLTLTAMAAAVILAGCAPTQLGNSMWDGKVSDLLREDGKVEVVSNGNTIKVRIMLESGDTCEGEFTMTGEGSGYILYGQPHIQYRGMWSANLSPACQKELAGPGGQSRMVQINQPSLFGSDTLQVCTQSSEKFCIPSNTLKIWPKES